MLPGRDVSEAAGKVRALGYYPVNVTPANGAGVLSGRRVAAISGGRTRPIIDSAGPAPDSVSHTGKKVGRVHILLFTRELADLIDAGLPIDRALTVLIEQNDNDALVSMIQGIQGDVRAGNPLSEALRAFPREFPPLYANMIHAGEVSGQLADVMMRLADFLEKEHVRRSQIIAALTYPMVLIGVAVLAVTFLLWFVIPRLEGVFEELGTGLPLPTQILLSSSAFMGKYWWAIVLGMVGGFYAFKAWIATGPGRRTWDGFKLTVPLFGGLTHKVVMARYVRTLGTLLGGGVPILDSMEISSTAVGNSVTGDHVLESRDAVRQGETLSSSMSKTGGFVPLVIHMSAVGEETGRLPGMLVRTADTLDFEVDNTMRRLTSLVEPLVVLFMGGFVGFVVLSILLPIFEANTVVK